MESIMKENTIRILEAFAYISEHISKKNMYNVLKVFYLADKLHMERYGRFIFNDEYSAMPKGPVPSRAYDLIKNIRRNQELPFSIETPVKLLSDHQVIPLRSADEDVFSGSDLKCLDEIIELSKTKDLGEESHDNAWKNTPRNAMMTIESIISTLQNSNLLLDLHQNRYA